MKITGLILNETGGFISTQDEDESRKGWFFWSKEQVRDIARSAIGSAEHDDMEESLWLVDLPLTAVRLPIMVDGYAAVTVSAMVSVVSQLTEGRTVTVVSAPVGMVYYSFHPANKDVQCGLIGWSDQQGRHHLVIYFSREQGRQLYRKRMRWVPNEKTSMIKDTLDHPSLNEYSPQPIVQLDGDFVAYLNCAYYMQKRLIAQSGTEN